MDKGRGDVRRGTNRFSKKPSGLISGFPGKLKKGGIFKKLGFTAEVNSSHEGHHHHHQQKDMVCEIEASTKKSKVPKRNFKDTNGVVHASVPRKLRSAMKKRKLEYVSRSSQAPKKLNVFKTGVESPKDCSPKDCLKREKQEMESKAVTEPISKDEEEVVETLYALAGMFPGTDGGSDNVLPDEKEAKVETVKDSSFIPEAEPTTMGESVSVLSSTNANQIGETPVRQAENFNGSTGTLDFLSRLKQNPLNVTEAPEKRIDIALAVSTIPNNINAVGTNLETTSGADYKSSGLALWPGLASAVNPRAHVLSKPSAVKVPPWMGGAASPSKTASFRGDPSRVQPKKLKRCASHIYISRLIRVLQTGTSPRTLLQNEPKPSEVSVSDLRCVSNSLEQFTFDGDALNSHRYPNAKLVKDMTQNQSYDFLSLSSAGDSKIMGNDATNGGTSTSASTSTVQSHFALLNSIPQQHHALRTFSMPQQEMCHISSPYNNRLPSAAASISHQRPSQLPPYLPGPFAAAAAYHNKHQQQQQQQFWATTQYRAAAGNPMLLNQYMALQNGKPYHATNPSSQSTMASLHAAASTRYNNISQQQQRLMAAATTMSLNHNPSLVMNRQEHHLPFVYEDTRIPLQLLCNDQS